MLDALLDEEFDTKKKAKAGAKGLDLDSLIDEQAAQAKQDPGMTWADVGNATKTAVLPTIGQVGGAALGTLAGPFAPAAVPTLEALGGMGGEYLNQKFGITEPSNTAIAAQGIIPGALRAGSMLKHVAPPSTHGAQFLNQIARPEAEYQLGKLGIVPGAASRAMTDATQHTMDIPAQGVRTRISEELEKMSGSTGAETGLYKGTTGYLQTLDNTLFKSGAVMSPALIQKELRDVRAVLNQIGDKRPNGVEKAALVGVKESLEEALMHNPAGTKLAGARHEVLRESVHKDLLEMTFQADKTMAGQGMQTQFNAAEVLRKLEGKGKDTAFQKRFNAAFEPEDQQNILKIYRKLNTFDKLAPPAGVNAGSLKEIRRIGTGAATGGIATMLGAPASVAAGVAGATIIGGPVADTGRILWTALSTHEGRRVFKDILADPKVMSWGALVPRLTAALSATEPAQSGIRQLSGSAIEAVTPFENER